MNTDTKRKILIVDDETFNLIALTHMLEADYKISAIKNGADAVSAARDNKPDLILLDLIMPDTDGFEVLSELKKLPQTSNIPVVLISGLSNAKDEERGRKLGAADYLAKPFSQIVLKRTILKHINT